MRFGGWMCNRKRREVINLTTKEREDGSVIKARKVRVIVNPRSGFYWSFDVVRRAFDLYWEKKGIELTYQFSQGFEDSAEKALRAAAQGIELLIVVGGDGTFSSIGTAVLGTDTAIGIIPAGSGNGLARHFEIPLAPEAAIKTLAAGVTTDIDVGLVNERPFFITCSMAWDAALVEAFDRSPVRGIIPYIFAGAYQFFEYKPQRMRLDLDSGERLTLPDPMVCTVANLTQYGGGAVIAPHARPDDGLLELIVSRKRDMPIFLANIGRFLSGKVTSIPKVISRRFRSLTVIRERASPIQIDGELHNAPARIEIRVKPRALKLLVPRLSHD